MIQKILEQADELAEFYKQQRDKTAKQTGPRKAFIKELKNRLEKARKRQDDAAVARYESRLQAIEDEQQKN